MTRDGLVFLAVHLISGLRIEERLRLLDKVDDLVGLAGLTRTEIEVLIGRRLRSRPTVGRALGEEARRIMDGLSSARTELVLFTEDEYPPLLREIYDPPLVLFRRGRTIPSGTGIVAMVGTRHPSGAGRRAAFSLGYELGRDGIPVVSGLALGIDAESHRGVLSGGGVCVAVLGHGTDSVHPKANRQLASAILEGGGCLLSEYPPGTLPAPYRFPERNRLISGVADAVVVVEAPMSSGALITADFALDQGRELFVHAEGLAGPSGAGTRRLAEDGARPLPASAEVLSLFRTRRNETGGRETAGHGLEGAGRALAAGLELELAGEIVKHNGSFYRRNGDGI